MGLLASQPVSGHLHNATTIEGCPQTRWGKQVSGHWLAACLDFLPAADIAKATAACTAWRLSRGIEDRLFKSRYEADFEAESVNRAEIAHAGRETPWKVRYKRRLHVHRNWERGNCRELGWPHEISLRPMAF